MMAGKESASKYIQKTEHVLTELKIVNGTVHSDAEKVKKIIEEAKRYLEDAKYYFESRRFETSLASVAYCEGLLDALRMMGYVEFSWR
jgi:FAD synthetase